MTDFEFSLQLGLYLQFSSKYDPTTSETINPSSKRPWPCRLRQFNLLSYFILFLVLFILFCPVCYFIFYMILLSLSFLITTLTFYFISFYFIFFVFEFFTYLNNLGRNLGGSSSAAAAASFDQQGYLQR